MSIHGVEIMQAVILILEGDHPIEVKEQVILLHLHITFTSFMNLGDFPSCSDKMLFSSSFPVLFQMPSLLLTTQSASTSQQACKVVFLLSLLQAHYMHVASALFEQAHSNSVSI